MGSHHKPGNHGSAPLPRRDGGEEQLLCEMGCEGYSNWLWASLCVSSCSKAVFFPKVISPSNYNGAVVTMVVVRNHSRRYKPPSSPFQRTFSVSYSSWRRGILIRALNTSGTELRRLPEFTWSLWYRWCLSNKGVTGNPSGTHNICFIKA